MSPEHENDYITGLFLTVFIETFQSEALADPAASWGGGGHLVKGSMPGYPKTKHKAPRI